MGFHEKQAETLSAHLSKVWEARRVISERAEIVTIGAMCHEMLAHVSDAHSILLEPSDQDTTCRFEGWSRQGAPSVIIGQEDPDWDDNFNDDVMWQLASSIEWRAMSDWSFATETHNGNRITFVIAEALTWLHEQLGASFDTPSDLSPAGIEAWLADHRESA